MNGEGNSMMNDTMATDFTIGTVFKTRGKHSQLCTVVDVLKTYNYAGELLDTRYVAVHEFMGQAVIDRTVIATTIKMGLVVDAAPKLPRGFCDGRACDGHYYLSECSLPGRGRLAR